MDIILLGIYSFFVWLIFFKLIARQVNYQENCFLGGKRPEGYLPSGDLLLSG